VHQETEGLNVQPTGRGRISGRSLAEIGQRPLAVTLLARRAALQFFCAAGMEICRNSF
jgi:hypothetical protein